MQKFENFFSSTLTTGIDTEATFITLTDVSGLSLETGETYQAALQKPGTPDPEIEIVTVTNVAANVLTIVRGQETTDATTFSTGDLCEIRLTAGGLNAFLQRSEVLNEDDFASASTTLPPSQQSTAAYITSYVANLDPFTFKDGLDAATNPDLPAGDAGDTYKITSNGTVSGVAVQSGDTAICTVDDTVANTPVNWIFGQGNIEQATTAEAEAGTDDAKYMTPLKSKELVTQEIGAIPEKDWAILNFTTSQTSGFTVGSAAQFDTITKRTGSGISLSAGVITLPKGKKYMVTGFDGIASSTSGIKYLNLTRDTAPSGAYANQSLICCHWTTSYINNYGNITIALDFTGEATDVDISLRLGGTMSIASIFCALKIEEID